MGSRPALALLTVLAPLLLVGLALDLSTWFWVTIPILCAMPVLLMAIAGGPGKPSSGFLVLLWLLLSGAWLSLWWLGRAVDLQRPHPDHAALVLVVMLVGLGLLPLLLVGLEHARLHDRSNRDDLP